MTTGQQAARGKGGVRNKHARLDILEQSGKTYFVQGQDLDMSTFLHLCLADSVCSVPNVTSHRLTTFLLNLHFNVQNLAIYNKGLFDWAAQWHGA